MALSEDMLWRARWALETSANKALRLALDELGYFLCRLSAGYVHVTHAHAFQIWLRGANEDASAIDAVKGELLRRIRARVRAELRGARS